jgi:Uma2 family endonuclease
LKIETRPHQQDRVRSIHFSIVAFNRRLLKLNRQSRSLCYYRIVPVNDTPMATVVESQPKLTLPDHTQLPESDGTFVKSFQEHPQSLLLTSSISPVLKAIHPDGNYAIGQDSGIYWRLTEPPEKGAESPDWFYVPNVSPLLDGKRRRSYVIWKEIISPLIAIEFTSGDGSEERDNTSPLAVTGAKAGKFWVYEQAIKIPFYAIYEVEKASVEVYRSIDGRYQRCSPNERGHYPIPPLGVELGIWQGEYLNQTFPWLRWWDSEGNLLLSAEEREDLANIRTNLAVTQAREADRRAQQLADKLREMGIDPDNL